MSDLKELQKTLKKNKKTRKDLSDSLGSTLTAGLQEMGYSLAKMFGAQKPSDQAGGASGKRQITSAMEEWEASMADIRKEGIA